MYCFYHCLVVVFQLRYVEDGLFDVVFYLVDYVVEVLAAHWEWAFEDMDCLLAGLDKCGWYLVGVVDFVYDHFGEGGAQDRPIFHF